MESSESCPLPRKLPRLFTATNLAQRKRLHLATVYSTPLSYWHYYMCNDNFVLLLHAVTVSLSHMFVLLTGERLFKFTIDLVCYRELIVLLHPVVTLIFTVVIWCNAVRCAWDARPRFHG